MAVLLQYFYDGVLMLGKDLGEAIGLIDFFGNVLPEFASVYIDPKDFAGSILDRSLRPFVHRIEGNILFLLIALKDGRVFEAGHYREIDRIVVRCPGS